MPDETVAVIFALLVTVYFWYQNIKGIEDSSDKSRKIIRFSMIIVPIIDNTIDIDNIILTKVLEYGHSHLTKVQTISFQRVIWQYLKQF